MAMVAPLVIAKLFSPALFGNYSLAKMIVFFFTSLLISSTQAPFIVFANQERAKTGKINKSFSVQCIFFAFSIAAFLSLNLIFRKAIIAFAEISPTDLPFIWLAFIGLALKTFLCNLFMAMGQRLKNSIAELIFGSLTLSLVFVFYLTDTINLKTVFLIYFISAVFLVFILIWTIDFRQLVSFSIDREVLKDMFNFTKWVMLGATAVYFINWGNNLVLRFFAVSMGDIGTYNVGYQIFKGTVMLTFIVNTYFLPFVSEHIGNETKMRDYLFSKRPKIILMGLVVIGLFFAMAGYLFELVFSDVYEGSVVVLRILLVASVLMLYSIFYDPILHSLNRYRFTQTVNVLQVLLSLLLALLLVPLMGLVGAALATVFAYLFRAVTIEVYFRVKLKRLLKL